jgi:uncharacterized Ntn-hydrolase superfamily protein
VEPSSAEKEKADSRASFKSMMEADAKKYADLSHALDTLPKVVKQLDAGLEKVSKLSDQVVLDKQHTIDRLQRELELRKETLKDLQEKNDQLKDELRVAVERAGRHEGIAEERQNALISMREQMDLWVEFAQSSVQKKAEKRQRNDTPM